MGIMTQINQICKSEMESRMQGAASQLEKELDTAMQQAVESVVYGAGSPESFPRSGAYATSWKTTASGEGLNCHAEMEYQPTGSHPSVNGTSDVTGFLDSIIIDSGAGPAVQSFANSPRDHFTQVDAKAESIADAVVDECLG